MSSDHKIVIDMDRLMDDPGVLEKFHECASLMIQSANAEQARLGYRMLDVMDACLLQAHKESEPE
ncbi:MAG: hypothetical protein CO187_06305 [Zetaproteobacteria bacterium CG_4_9_14_3_um_filter_53_7]|nr:MAG: hypothetical protein CO187_06305 [Zetaproteobacteria bacterium CG_4_9_14_3_um_filter_53_7]